MRQNQLLKAVLAAALGAALLLPAAGAAELPVSPAGETEKPAYELTQRGTGFPIQVWGKAVELGEQSLTLQNDNENDAYPKIIVNVGEDTLILDAADGSSKTFADIQKDETVYAWVGPVMTKSLPPITNAQVILCGIPVDYQAPNIPTYAEVQSVTKTETGLDAYMTGDIVLHLGEDVQLLAGPGNTCGTMSLEDICPGVRLLSWYSVVALSMPAQTTPDKVMIFPSAYAGWVTVHGMEVSVNGGALDLSGANAARVEENRLMVPVRKIAEALGCEIAWEPYTNRVTVTKDGAEVYQFALGGTQAVRGDVTIGLLTPAKAIDGVTYMALDDLMVLHELKLEKSWF